MITPARSAVLHEFECPVQAVRPFGETRIGGDAMSDGVRYFQGRMAQVAVFTSSLSASQVSQLYNLGMAGEQVAPMVIQAGAGNIQLSWLQGTLLEATNLGGPWITNVGAVSPWTEPTGTGQRYYRLKLP